MESNEYLLYKNLYLLLTEPKIQEQLVNYAKIQYNKAVDCLISAKGEQETGIWQGKVAVWKQIIDLKEHLQGILKHAKQ